MRVLIATGLYPPEIGGPATYARLFEERLPDYGFEVDVLPFREVKRFPRIVRHFLYIFKLIRMSRFVDVILVQDTVSTGFPAALVSRIIGIPLIVRVPGDYAWEQGRQRFGVLENLDDFQNRRYGPVVQFLRAVQKFTVLSASRVIAPSKYLANIVSNWVGKDQKIEIIYNGVELSLSVKEPEKRPVGEFIVSVSRLVPWKGFDSLIKIVNREPNWFLAIIGDGPQKDTLEEKAGERVRLKGSLPQDEMLGWCNVADVFVLNSSYEGLSHTLLEVMALGVPIIATNVGGNTELIEDGVHGLLVDAEDDTALHNAIKRLLGDSTLRKKLAENARRKAEEFSVNYTIEETVKLLEDVVFKPKTEGSHVLMISSDKKIFEKDSAVRRRIGKYGTLFDSLDAVVFTKRKDGFKATQISKNTWTHPTNSFSRWLYVFDAIRIGRRISHINVVTAQDPFESGLAAFFVSKKTSAKLHVQVHTDVTSSYFRRSNFLNRFRLLIAKWVFARADGIRAVSKRVKRGIEVKYRPSSNISILPIFVDTNEYKRVRKKKHARFRTVFLVVSRLEREKNTKLALEAFANLKTKEEGIGLIIVGDGSERRNLEILSDNLGISDSVEFVGRQDPTEYYKMADLVLFPSHYDGYGMVIVEALASGVSVLSTDVGVALEAGAIVSTPERFGGALYEWIESGPRKGVLKHKPYKNEAEYLARFKEDIERCI